MKKTILSVSFFAIALSLASVASAVTTFTTDATTSLNGISFSPSTGVNLSALATTTDWAAISKHVTGGTTGYGLTSDDTNIKMRTGMEKDDPVDNPSSATALPTTYE